MLDLDSLPDYALNLVYADSRTCRGRARLWREHFADSGREYEQVEREVIVLLGHYALNLLAERRAGPDRAYAGRCAEIQAKVYAKLPAWARWR